MGLTLDLSGAITAAGDRTRESAFVSRIYASPETALQKSSKAVRQRKASAVGRLYYHLSLHRSPDKSLVWGGSFLGRRSRSTGSWHSRPHALNYVSKDRTRILDIRGGFILFVAYHVVLALNVEEDLET